MSDTSTIHAANAIVPAPPRPIPGGVFAAIAGAILLALSNALIALLPGYNAIETTEDLVRVLAAHPGLAEAEAATGLLTAALLVPGIWTVASRLSARAPVLAGIGGWLMATGYVFYVVLPTETLTALAVALSGEDPSTFATAIDQFQPATTTALYVVFGLGALAGGLILGIAALRQKGAVPAWAGWALIASEPVRVVGLIAGLGFGPPLASLLIAAGFAGILLTRPAANRS